MQVLEKPIIDLKLNTERTQSLRITLKKINYLQSDKTIFTLDFITESGLNWRLLKELAETNLKKQIIL